MEVQDPESDVQALRKLYGLLQRNRNDSQCACSDYVRFLCNMLWYSILNLSKQVIYAWTNWHTNMHAHMKYICGCNDDGFHTSQWRIKPVQTFCVLLSLVFVWKEWQSCLWKFWAVWSSNFQSEKGKKEKDMYLGNLLWHAVYMNHKNLFSMTEAHKKFLRITNIRQSIYVNQQPYSSMGNAVFLACSNWYS